MKDFIKIWARRIDTPTFEYTAINPIHVIFIELIEEGFKLVLTDNIVLIAMYNMISVDELHLDIDIIVLTEYWKKENPNNH